MRTYFHALAQLFRIIAEAWRDPKVHLLMVLAVGVLFTGTVVYHFLEGWGWIDSLYFSTVTLATVGYGDFHPTTSAGKLFTILFILIGVGIFVGIFTVISRASVTLGTAPQSPDPSNPSQRP